MTQLTDDTRLDRIALVKCQFGVVDTHHRPFRQIKHASPGYTGRPILMSHTLTSPAIQRMSSQTVYCRSSNICVEFKRSSRHPFATKREQNRIMTYAIIRGKNGRRHEVDFAGSPVRVEVYASEGTIETYDPRSAQVGGAPPGAGFFQALIEHTILGTRSPTALLSVRVGGLL
jgi:hypothetical protein